LKDFECPVLADRDVRWKTMVTMVSCALSRDLMQNEALLPLTKRWQGSLDGSIPFAGSVIMQSVWWVHGFLADPTVQDMETLVEGGAASWALEDVYIRPLLEIQLPVTSKHHLF
jgi:hypothetical protein